MAGKEAAAAAGGRGGSATNKECPPVATCRRVALPVVGAPSCVACRILSSLRSLRSLLTRPASARLGPQAPNDSAPNSLTPQQSSSLRSASRVRASLQQPARAVRNSLQRREADSSCRAARCRSAAPPSPPAAANPPPVHPAPAFPIPQASPLPSRWRSSQACGCCGGSFPVSRPDASGTSTAAAPRRPAASCQPLHQRRPTRQQHQQRLLLQMLHRPPSASPLQRPWDQPAAIAARRRRPCDQQRRQTSRPPRCPSQQPAPLAQQPSSPPARRPPRPARPIWPGGGRRWGPPRPLPLGLAPQPAARPRRRRWAPPTLQPRLGQLAPAARPRRPPLARIPHPSFCSTGGGGAPRR